MTYLSRVTSKASVTISNDTTVLVYAPSYVKTVTNQWDNYDNRSTITESLHMALTTH